MNPLIFLFPFFTSAFCQPLAIRVAPAVRFCYIDVVERREREQGRGQRRGSGRICRATGRIARILERQGDGRRGNTSRRRSRSRSQEERETADDELKRARRDREISFSRNPANQHGPYKAFPLVRYSETASVVLVLSPVDLSAFDRAKKTCFCTLGSDIVN